MVTNTYHVKLFQNLMLAPSGIGWEVWRVRDRRGTTESKVKPLTQHQFASKTEHPRNGVGDVASDSTGRAALRLTSSM